MGKKTKIWSFFTSGEEEKESNQTTSEWSRDPATIGEEESEIIPDIAVEPSARSSADDVWPTNPTSEIAPEIQDMLNTNAATEKELASTSVNSYSPEALANGSMGASKIPTGAGLVNSGFQDPHIVFNRADGETVFPSTIDTAQVIVGNDRPASKPSGYGGVGSNRAASVDVVVGRMASARGGKGAKDKTYAENDFAADAARIHISQLTDIDKNFGIVEGISGVQAQRSGIGIKADGVRMIGREGIKLVTGTALGWKGLGPKGEPNSLGGKIQPAPTIELIAGNRSEPQTVFNLSQGGIETVGSLQGVAKGENVVAALRDLGAIVDELWSATFNFMMAQMVFNAGLAPCLAPLPGAVVMAGIAAGVSTTQAIYSLNPLYQTRNNRNIWETNYLTRAGYRFIESKNVFST